MSSPITDRSKMGPDELDTLQQKLNKSFPTEEQLRSLLHTSQAAETWNNTALVRRQGQTTLTAKETFYSMWANIVLNAKLLFSAPFLDQARVSPDVIASTLERYYSQDVPSAQSIASSTTAAQASSTDKEESGGVVRRAEDMSVEEGEGGGILDVDDSIEPDSSKKTGGSNESSKVEHVNDGETQVTSQKGPMRRGEMELKLDSESSELQKLPEKPITREALFDAMKARNDARQASSDAFKNHDVASNYGRIEGNKYVAKESQLEEAYKKLADEAFDQAVEALGEKPKREAMEPVINAAQHLWDAWKDDQFDAKGKKIAIEKIFNILNQNFQNGIFDLQQEFRAKTSLYELYRDINMARRDLSQPKS